MFVKMPHLDPNRLQILGGSAQSAKIVICFRSERNPAENPANGQKNGVIFHGKSPAGISVQGPKPLLSNSGASESRGSVAKGVAYGGCIPSILQALETVDDLDEAFKPWEETLTRKERTIILKQQTNWVRALKIFEWFKRKGCYELNVIHYNILLRILGRSQRWEQVENLWSEMENKGITPTNATYSTLIDVYSKAGFTDHALMWLNKMYKQGLQPDEVTVGIVLLTYKKAKQFQKAEQFLGTWSSGNPDNEKHHSLFMYNTLIDTYGKAGQFKEASETFEEMLREGIAPNTVTFNTMIHIYGRHGNMDKMASLMAKMEDMRCPPDTITYNILISLFAKDDNICKAVYCFKKMKAVGLKPDVVSYRILLNAFSERDMVRAAESLLLEMNERHIEIDEYMRASLNRLSICCGMLE